MADSSGVPTSGSNWRLPRLMLKLYLDNWREYLKTWGTARRLTVSWPLRVVIYTALALALLFVIFGIGKDD